MLGTNIEGAPRCGDHSAVVASDASTEVSDADETYHSMGGSRRTAALALAWPRVAARAAEVAGGAEEQEPVVLTFASFTDDIQPQLRVFAEEVVRRSDGTLRIEFKPAWRAGDPDAERGRSRTSGPARPTWPGRSACLRQARREELAGPPRSAPRRQLRAPRAACSASDPHERSRASMSRGGRDRRPPGADAQAARGQPSVPLALRLRRPSHRRGGERASPFGRTRLSAPPSRRCPQEAL